MVSRETSGLTLEAFLERFRRTEALVHLGKALDSGTAGALRGLTLPALVLTLLALWKSRSRPLLVQVDDAHLLEELYHLALTLHGREVYFYPPRTASPTHVPGFLETWERYQAEVLERAGRPDFTGLVLAATQSLEDPVPAPSRTEELLLQVGSTCALADLTARLERWCYERVEHVVTPKSFAVRGGIVDIFLLSDALPSRLEFFGPRLESLRTFNPFSQRTTAQLATLTLLPPPSAPSENTLTLRDLLPDSSARLGLSGSAGPEGILATTPPAPEPQAVLCESTPFVRQTWEAKREFIAAAGRRYGPAGVYLFADSREQYAFLSRKLTVELQWVAAPLPQGFASPTLGVACYTQSELLHSPPRLRRRWAVDAGSAAPKPLGNLDAIEWGDYLVHQDFGIGRYRGLEQIRNRESVQECIKIEYADHGVVYVPVDKFTRVHKYISSGDGRPVLSHLGSAAWEQQKLQTRRSAARIIRELVDLYAHRNLPRGFSYRPDPELQQELEASFQYEETPDQLAAIQSVARDLDGSVPMDRLICGDVGFGKTEVALRAALIAVTSGYQVMFLAPTTVLADQHFLTARNRLGDLGVRVELLSRFRSRREQSRILENLRTGKVDLLVGTHRLLSPDVSPARLGLLIVDEEHRFGVKHKERIKTLRKNVDVLTLSATPIPRTLQQSLIGIRDISKIETPPRERLPVATWVHYFDWQTITPAIRQELDRHGQVFFLHNDVASLPLLTQRLQQQFPDHRVAMAHGQMPSRALETTMLDFFAGQISILACTTIIESGLDIQNANTVIITAAHRFGLAQLYQIRGRVGRSHRQAYCLMMIPSGLELSRTAYQRLKAIEYYSNLGSGYEIALKDLEIRGAGNLFGYEQSGQVGKVGFELYCKILKEAVEEAAGQAAEQSPAARILFDGAALIPSAYIPLVQDRLFFYQQLAAAATEADVGRIREELEDRYGRPPLETRQLLEVARLRVSASGTGIATLSLGSTALQGTITAETRFPSPEQMTAELTKFLQPAGKRFRFSLTRRGLFEFQVDTGSLDRSRELARRIVDLFRSPAAR